MRLLILIFLRVFVIIYGNVHTVFSFEAPRLPLPPVDFSGKWKMDLGSSDKLTPLLKELGVPRILAPIMERLGVRQEIDGENLQFRVITRLKTDEFRLSVDTSTDCPSPTGGLTKATSRWAQVVNDKNDDGYSDGAYALETTQKIERKDGKVFFVTRRTLEEEGLVLIEFCKVIKNGTTLAACRRVLRKEEK